MSVTFGRGQADNGTKVRIETAVDAPPAPELVEPLGQPFDVVIEKGAARAGHVAVTLGKLPDHLTGVTIFMFVADGHGGWEALPATTDQATGVIEADWPHFSKGFPGRMQAFGRTAWNTVVKGGRSVKAAAVGAAKAVAGGMAALTGGTLEKVSCEPADNAWRFEGRNGEGGNMTFAPLTGCGQPFNTERGSWTARIGNRYPAPYLVSVPVGVSPPGLWDSPESMDVADVLIAMVLSRWNRIVVPGGQSIPVRITPAAGSEISFGGYTDPWTLAFRAAAIAATIATRGESGAAVAAAKSEVRAEFELWDQALAQARRSGNARLYLSDVADATGWDSAVARKERAATFQGGRLQPTNYSLPSIYLTARSDLSAMRAVTGAYERRRTMHLTTSSLAASRSGLSRPRRMA